MAPLYQNAQLLHIPGGLTVYKENKVNTKPSKALLNTTTHKNHTLGNIGEVLTSTAP